MKAGAQIPEGYYYLTWGGEFENQRRAMRRLMIIVPISVLVNFIVEAVSLRMHPAALSHAIGSDTQRPFAIVIIGGRRRS